MSDEQPSGMNPAVKIILIVGGVLCVLFCGVVGVLGWIVKDNVETYEAQASVSATADITLNTLRQR